MEHGHVGGDEDREEPTDPLKMLEVCYCVKNNLKVRFGSRGNRDSGLG